MTRQRLRRLLSVLLAALLLMSSVAVAGAAPVVPNDDDALQLLLNYGLVKGDEFGNLNLDKQITRAEASTVFVRVMGQESTAALLADVVPFTDAKGHWAAGYIAVAQRLGLMKGRTETTFDPDAQITNQEVYTVILRLVKREPLGPWNPLVVMQTANSLGLTPTNIDLSLLGPAPALRGTIFNGLGKAVAGVQLPDGKTVLSTYVDQTPPTLRLDTLPESTGSNSIKISGTAEGANVLVINNQQYRLTSSRFSIDVSLQSGNNTLNIQALDWAGNQATRTVQIARASEAKTIVVAGELTVKAGQSVALQAIAYDQNGVALAPTEVTATVSNNLGRYDAANGKFTAGNTAGTGTITFKAGDATETVNITVLGLDSSAKALRIKDATSLAGSINKNTTVQVEVLDADGNPTTSDDGRTVTLVATGLSGARVVNSTAQTVKGVATFTVTSSAMGEVTLTAASNGLTNGVGSLTFASSTRIKLTASPSSAIADGMTPVTIHATLVDENGKDVSNTTGSDLFITLNSDSTNSGFSNPLVIIRRSATSSVGSDATLVPGFKSETVKVTGRVTTGQNYTVLPVTVDFKEIVRGTASKLEIVGGTSLYTPGVTPVSLTVRVTDKDGNLIPEGTYAYQVEVSTSNGEALVNGMPDGLDLQIGTNEGTPIKGATTGDAVVGRTKYGTASLKLTYNKSGIITLKVVGVPAAEEAVDSNGEVDAASSTSSFTSVANTISFVDRLDHLQAMVESPGSSVPTEAIGVMPASTTGSIKVKVYMVDDTEGRIPTGAGTATLKKISGTATSASTTTDTATGGMVEFSIRSTGNAGHDVWQVTLGGKTVNFDLYTNSTKPAAPEILSINGSSGNPNRIAIGDQYMNIELDGAYTSPTYGYVKVFRSGSSSPVWTSGVINLGSLPAIQVPAEKVPNGAYTYNVSVYTGAESDKSNTWPGDGTKVVKETATTMDITKVRYNAKSGTLYITASGLASTGRIEGSNLVVRSATTGESTDLDGVLCDYTSSSTFACTGVDLPVDDFYGDVTLVTYDGWYVNDTNGSAAAGEASEKLANNKINPMGYIKQATVAFDYNADGDVIGGKLTIEGTNLSIGNISLDKIELTDGTDTFNLTSTFGGSSTGVKVDSKSSGAVVITLGKLADEIASLGGGVHLNATSGWYTYDGAFNAEIIDVDVYTKLTISRVEFDKTAGTLTIVGSGFKGAAVTPSKLYFKRRNGTAVAFTATAGDVEVNDVGTIITIDISGNAAALDAAITATSTYLLADPGWLLNGSDWPASPIEDRVILIRRS